MLMVASIEDLKAAASHTTGHLMENLQAHRRLNLINSDEVSSSFGTFFASELTAPFCY